MKKKTALNVSYVFYKMYSLNSHEISNIWKIWLLDFLKEVHALGFILDYIQTS